MSIDASETAALDAVGQAELVARGEVSPAEMVEAAIERIERLNPSLNAVIHRLYEKVRAEAQSPALPDGPFRGVPFLIKDIVAHTEGDPLHAGMRLLRDLSWHETADTEMAARLRRAGFLIVGKTNTPELAFSPTTEPVAYGPSRNPWNVDLSTSGSSGGAAAAVASRMVAAAHGNDMGGSIRTPASACGLVGLKPTRGRNTLAPDFGEFWWQTTHEHVLTRTVRDTAAILDVTSGPGPGDPYFAPPPARPFAREVGTDPGKLRIGIFTDRPGGRGIPHADCHAAAMAAGRMMESLGHHVEVGGPPILSAADDGSASIVFTVSIARELERWSRRTGHAIGRDDVEPTTWLAAEMGRGASATMYVEATEKLHAYARELAAWWEQGFDLLLTPTLAEPPWPLGLLSADAADPMDVLLSWTHYSPYCAPFNISGQPAVSLPLCTNAAGLPIGIQMVAKYAREDILLRVSSQLESAFPWHDRRPAVCA